MDIVFSLNTRPHFFTHSNSGSSEIVVSNFEKTNSKMLKNVVDIDLREKVDILRILSGKIFVPSPFVIIKVIRAR